MRRDSGREPPRWRRGSPAPAEPPAHVNLSSGSQARGCKQQRTWAEGPGFCDLQPRTL